MTDLPRVTLLFSQLWLASMLAMLLIMALSGSAGAGWKMAHCAPCVAANKATADANRARRLTVASRA